MIDNLGGGSLTTGSLDSALAVGGEGTAADSTALSDTDWEGASIMLGAKPQPL